MVMLEEVSHWGWVLRFENSMPDLVSCSLLPTF